MKIIYGKYYFKNGNGWAYEFKPDKMMDTYCCERMMKMLARTYDPFTILDNGELVIESYDFDDIKSINFCMCCGEKIEVELIE